ncbi:GNAT family N-acetyltransferase [Aeromicrobium chenweiae]|uniref:GNAT family N-acetyltransferase n=1 Tax=Aeromicrobium chenweiae TaxID=2079793 RepID=UPI001902140B|nr:GNAT family N-acetyltransferase [Aeromicrobium chenweiae]
MTVIRATLEDVLEAAQLFAAYREFHGEPNDVAAAEAFLAARLARGESVVLLAVDEDEVVGFAQVYPTFSSTRLAPVWVLNDLFVVEHARGTGAADELLHTVAALAADAGAVSVGLSTAHANERAQAVYVRHGYQLDEVYRSYEKPLT